MTDVAAERLRALAETLWTDKELGAKVQARAKEMFPDVKTNEDVFSPVLNPLREENAAMAKRLEAMQEKLAAREKAEEKTQRVSLEKQLDAARKNFNLTDEGFDKMVARMKETGNYSDADAAAAWVASKAPPAAVAGPTWKPQSMDLFGIKNHDESMAALHRDPVGYQDAQLAEFVSDPDKYVADTFGRAA